MTDEAENLGVSYRIDAGRSNLTVQAFAEGLLSIVGHNPTFAIRKYGGEIQFASGNREVDSMLLVIQAETLSLLDKMSRKDALEIERAMHEDVLETARFPEIFFVSKDVSMREISSGRFAVKADGYVSLHGESREQVVEAEALLNGEIIRAQGQFKLKQSDFNIEQFKAMGGTLKVKDEVRISFDIAAQI